MGDMQHMGHRITFLRTLGAGCALSLMAVCVVMSTPYDAQAKAKDSLIPKDNKANTHASIDSPRKQPASRSANAVAYQYEPQTAVTYEFQPQPAPEPITKAVAPQVSPISEAPTPEVEPVSSISSIPSRQQLVSLLSKPLLSVGTLSYRSFATYPDADSLAVIRPSPEGWKILGVPWVWWAAGTATLWLGNRWLKWRA